MERVELTRELITSHGGAAATDEIRNPNVPNRQLHQAAFRVWTSGCLGLRISCFGFRRRQSRIREMIALSLAEPSAVAIVYRESFVSWNRMVP